VAYLFEKRGVIRVDGSRYGEDDLLAAIDAGANDIVPDDEVVEVVCEPSLTSEVRNALEQDGVEVIASELSYIPSTTVNLDEGQATSLLKLVGNLEDNDDVEAWDGLLQVIRGPQARISGADNADVGIAVAR
jgi:transcriptional/translational regulatory protein YebC/TACO1